MAKKHKIAKTSQEKLRDYETHLYFLWDARRLYQQQKDRFKQIASELRVLTCEMKTNRPLLLDLMDEYGFQYDVKPPGPCRGPIPMVGWRDDPMHQQLCKEVANAMGNEAKTRELLQKQAALEHPVPLRQFVNEALAVYIAPHDYSYRDLTLALAQQMGSSHEDNEVDEAIIKMRSVVLGGDEGHIASLIAFADLVIKVGTMFLDFIVRERGYQLRYFREERLNKAGE